MGKLSKKAISFLIISVVLCGSVNVNVFADGLIEGKIAGSFYNGSEEIIIEDGAPEEIVIEETVSDAESLLVDASITDPVEGSEDFFGFEFVYNDEELILTRHTGIQTPGLEKGVINIPDHVQVNGQSRRVTGIEPGLFKDDQNIRVAAIHADITDIPDECFCGAVNLEEVVFTDETVLPSNLKSIGNRAFYGCSKLRAVNIPDKNVSLGSEVFKDCTSLSYIYIPNMKSVGDDAFAGCTNLSSVVFADDAGQLGKNMFEGCSAIERIALPERIKAIPEGVFKNCTSLKLFTVPQSCKSIDLKVFYGCRRLQGVTITPATTEIRFDAFKECPFITIYCDENSYAKEFAEKNGIPWTYIRMEDIDLVTGEEDGFTYIRQNNITAFEKRAVITGYTGNDAEVTIPSSICEGLIKVSSFEPGIFSGNTYIRKVTLAEGFKEIPDRAFEGCSSIREVVIPDTVERIGAYAFNECTSLEKVNIPVIKDTYAERPFNKCTSLREISFAEGPLVYNYGMFSGCTGLKSIKLPESISAFSSYMFEGCTALEEITLPANSWSVGLGSFKGCTSLKKAYIPANTESFNSDSFEGCPDLTIYGESGSRAIWFAKYKNIKYVELGSSGEGERFGVTIAPATIDNTVGSLKVTSDLAEVVFDGGAVLVLAENHNGSNVSFVYDIIDDTDSADSALKPALDAALASGGRIMDFSLVDPDGHSVSFHSSTNNGQATITVPFETNVPAERVKVYYIAPDGTKIDMNGIYSSSKKTVTFATTHFSYFTIEIAEESGSGGGTSGGGNSSGNDVFSIDKDIVVAVNESRAIDYISWAASLALVWESSDPAVATVSGSGVVTGVREGEAIIRASIAGDPQVYDECRVTVRGVEDIPVITLLPPTSTIEKTKGKQLSVFVSPPGAVSSFVWTSSDDSVAPVSGSGYVIGMNVGTATITVSAENDPSLYATATVTVTDGSGSGGETPPGGGENPPGGGENPPGGGVNPPGGGENPPGGGENLPGGGENPPSGTIIPEDPYGDILLADRPDSVAAIPPGLWVSSASMGLHIYTGKAIKPEPRVYYGNVRLVSGRDYSLSYKNNVNAMWTANALAPLVSAKGKAGFAGTATSYFPIYQKNIADSDIDISFTNAYAAGAKKNPTLKFTVKSPTRTLKLGTDYTLTVKTVSGADVYDWRNAGTYILEAKGIKNYTGIVQRPFYVSALTPVGKLTVSAIKSQKYTGSIIVPPVTVKYKKEVLDQGIDYDVMYQNNVAVGTATVYVTGKGAYFGTIKKTFKITGTSIKKAKVSDMRTSVEYTGAEVMQPQAMLSYKGVLLKEGEDYIVSYKNNVNKGTASVTYTGRKGFTGALTKKYKIKALNIAGVSGKSRISVVYPPASQDGTQVPGIVKPQVYDTVGDAKVLLREGRDYTLSTKKKQPGVIIIKGRGNYTGKIQ